MRKTPRSPRVLPVVLAAVLWLLGAAALADERPAAPDQLLPVMPASAELAPGAPMPDFAAITDLRTRKLRFFAYLLPLVEAENQRLVQMRQRLEFIRDHVRFQREIPADDLAWLQEVSAEYEVDPVDPQEPGFWRLIRLRVDTVPENLVLVQAALESAWGTSRFARQGNNLFGQWCFCPGCGLVPADRPEDEDYEVARFDSVAESVASYMRNLNTGRSYRKLREMRDGMRNEGQTPEPEAIADGLMYYSERGSSYIDEIRSMLRHNAAVIREVRGHLAAES